MPAKIPKAVVESPSTRRSVRSEDKQDEDNPLKKKKSEDNTDTTTNTSPKRRVRSSIYEDFVNTNHKRVSKTNEEFAQHSKSNTDITDDNNIFKDGINNKKCNPNKKSDKKLKDGVSCKKSSRLKKKNEFSSGQSSDSDAPLINYVEATSDSDVPLIKMTGKTKNVKDTGINQENSFENLNDNLNTNEAENLDTITVNNVSQTDVSLDKSNESTNLRNQNQEKNCEYIGDMDDCNTTAVKKGRGRPRKINTSFPNPTTADSTPSNSNSFYSIVITGSECVTDTTRKTKRKTRNWRKEKRGRPLRNSVLNVDWDNLQSDKKKNTRRRNIAQEVSKADGILVDTVLDNTIVDTMLDELDESDLAKNNNREEHSRRKQKNVDNEFTDGSESENADKPRRSSRKRRLKKVVRYIDEESDEDTVEESDEERVEDNKTIGDINESNPPKKKVGRPRKDTKSIQNESNNYNKNKQSELNDSVIDNSLTTSILNESQSLVDIDGEPIVVQILPRKRGRPPKNSTPVEPVKRKITKKVYSSDSEATDDLSDTDKVDQKKRRRKRADQKVLSRYVKKRKSNETPSETDQPASKPCPHCGQPYDTAQRLRYHMMATHTLLLTKDSPNGADNHGALKVILQTLKKLICQKCTKDFKHIHYYQFHILWCGKEQERFRCTVCDKEVQCMWERSHMNLHKLNASRYEMTKDKDKVEVKKAKEAETTVPSGKRQSATKAMNLLQKTMQDDTKAETEDEATEDDDDDDTDSEESDEDVEKCDRKRERKKRFQPVTANKRMNKHVLKESGVLRRRVIELLQKKVRDHLKSVESSTSKCQGELFPHFMPNFASWKKCEPSEYEAYLPSTRQSCDFETRRLQGGDHDVPLRRLGLFQYTRISDSPIGERITMFTGGPVWAMAWCPAPVTTVIDQHLAIGCHQTMDETHGVSTPFSGPGIIQVWRFGGLCVDNRKAEPKMSLGLQHGNGCVYDLAWCPHGTYQPPTHESQEGDFPRLGLLAAAFSNGTVQIFSIPHTKFLPSDPESLPIYKVPPVTQLITSSCQAKWSAAMSISWQTCNGCRVIGVSFTNGVIHLWDLLTESPLLRTTTPSPTLYPYHSFKAHQCGRNKIRWIADSPYNLASVSIDQFLKVWDVRDTTQPKYSNSKAMVLSLESEYGGDRLLYTLDSITNDPRNKNSHTMWVNTSYGPLVNHSVLPGEFGATWDIAYSPWLGTLATCDEHGVVSGTYVAPSYQISRGNEFVICKAVKTKRKEQQNKTDDNSKLINSKSKTDKTSSNVTKSSNVTNTNCTNSSVTGDSNLNRESLYNDETYEECVDRFYLSFRDNSVNHKTNAVGNNRITFDRFPLNSFNKLSFNPNLSACNWLAIGSNAGFVRLHDLRVMFSTDDLRVLDSVFRR